MIVIEQENQMMSVRQKISIYRRAQQVTEDSDELFELIAFLHGLDKTAFQWEWLDASCVPGTVLPQVFINGEQWIQGRYPDIFELSEKLKIS